MGLFNLGKKKEQKLACACNASQSAVKEEESCCCNIAVQKCSCTDIGNNLTNIKVLGVGCKSCHELYENTKVAVKNAELSVEVEYITDLEKVMEYGVSSIPALVVNEKIISIGKVLKANDIEKVLHKLGF